MYHSYFLQISELVYLMTSSEDLTSGFYDDERWQPIGFLVFLPFSFLPFSLCLVVSALELPDSRDR